MQGACRGLIDLMGKNKDHKKLKNLKPFMVKNYLSVFVNCMIENPAFDSQVSSPVERNGKPNRVVPPRGKTAI